MQLAQQPLGATNRDLLISRIRLPGEIEIGCKMNDRADAAAAPLADLGQDPIQALLGGEIDLLERSCGWQLLRGPTVKRDHSEGRREPGDESFANEAAAAGYYDRVATFRHVGRTPRSTRANQKLDSLAGYHSLGNTLSGGFEPGGLIERMKAMIFRSWSELLMAAPIGGIGACTVPYDMRL